jgi:peptidoglycan/LPS O-acetylase OafA/YrhL
VSGPRTLAAPTVIPPPRAGTAEAGRDRSIDGLRAYAIAGVVLGHWLVTGLVLAPDGALHQASPLTAMPGLIPVTWVLQTLGLFFFAGGYASARSFATATAGGAGYRSWLRRRLGRLAGPAAALVGCGAALLLVASVLGVPAATLHTTATLLVSPLWFLLPFAALLALTGPLRHALGRWGPAALGLCAVALVAATDLAGRLSPATGAAWRVPLAVLGAWLVPYLMGMALAGGRLGGRRTGWTLALAGAAGMAGLILFAGYPASAVGVPGVGRSNLNPPTLVAVCLAVSQIGCALLLRPGLARLLRRPRWWGPTSALNRAAARVYLCHQPVLVGVTALVALGVGAAGGGGVPGLHTAPDGPAWVAARLGWLPVFALVLATLVAPHAPHHAAVRRAGADRVELISTGDDSP